MASNAFDVHSKIPTGSWTLYFRHPEETKWTMNTFISLGTVATWGEFWALMDALGNESFGERMYFMMNDPIPPLWESHQNIRGGYYSFRCGKRDAADAYQNYLIAAMLGGLSTDAKANRITGISIGPKRGFNIVKIWNTDSKQSSPAALNYGVHSLIKKEEMIYTPFIQKHL